MRALVIDGYNVIFRTACLSKLADKDLMLARNEVTKIARQYQRKIGGIDKVKVVFDGQDKYEGMNKSPYQKYSKTGQGDEEVIRTIALFSDKYDVTVVSDDNFVSNNARAHGATSIVVEEFLNVGRSIANKKTHSKVKGKKNSEKKISGKQAKNINKDLMKEWGIS